MENMVDEEWQTKRMSLVDRASFFETLKQNTDMIYNSTHYPCNSQLI